MSEKLQNSGTKRISQKALWLRQYYAVFLRALSFVVLIFCLWVRLAGRTANRFSWSDSLITVGGSIFGLLQKARCLPMTCVWKHRLLLIGLPLNEGGKQKS